MSRLLLVCLAAAVLLAACGGGDSTGPKKTTFTYGGVFAGNNGTEAGNFSVSIVVEDSSGSGSFVVNGVPKTLSSLIVAAGGDFTAAGQGFTFSGTVDDSTMAGVYTSAGGGGLFTGLRRYSGTGGTVTAYCGTHIGTRLGVPIGGAFTFVESGTSRRGVFTSVLEAPFHGLLRGTPGVQAITLDTISGNALLSTLGPSGFAASYATQAGDTGNAAGGICRSTVTSPIVGVIDGVLGSFDSLELGSYSLSLSNTGLGSSGNWKVGGVAHQFLAVISGVGTKVAAFDSTLRIIIDVGSAVDSGSSGRYSKNGAVAGLAAGLARKSGGLNTVWCGTNSSGGSFSFVMRPDSTLFGFWTSGSPVTSFQGYVAGRPGNDQSVMQGFTPNVTILPSSGAFAGVYFLSGSGGQDGTVTGALCP